MKKNILALMLLSMSLMLSACADSQQPIDTVPIDVAEDGTVSIVEDEKEGVKSADDSVDYDITSLSATMVYGQIADLLNNYEDYIDKTFKIEGKFETATLVDTNEAAYLIVINDALGCCPTGLEILLPDNVELPDNGSDIVIKGAVSVQEQDEYIRIIINATELNELHLTS